MILKNILTVELTMPEAGIVLNPSETITYEEIGSPEFIASCADEITTFVAQGKIKVFEDDGITEVGVVDVATISSGEKSTLRLENIDELSAAISPHVSRRFIFMKDSFMMNRNKTIKKPFPGSISSVSIRPRRGPILVTIYSDGVYFQEEEIGRNSLFEYNFDYKITDAVIILKNKKTFHNDIDIYIDGDTYLDNVHIQELIDGWPEDSPSHSDINKYMFDSK